MYKVSIITVTYNAENVIEKTLQSIKSQSFQDYELIVVDGKSSDGTINVLAKFQNIISHLISEKDKGIYDAMNKGINLSSGDFCMFLNAGDAFYNSDSLLTMLNSLSLFPNYDFYFFNAYYDKIGGLQPFKPYLQGFPFRFCHQSMLFRSKIIKEEQYDINYRLSGDSELIYRLLQSGYKYISVDEFTILEEFGRGATHENLLDSAKELYSIPYLRNKISCIRIQYNLFKIKVYTLLNKLGLI